MKTQHTKRQSARILKYMRSGKSISPISALSRFRCMRLAARIEELRDSGQPIVTMMVRRSGKKFAMYKLLKSRAHGRRNMQLAA